MTDPRSRETPTMNTRTTISTLLLVAGVAGALAWRFARSEPSNDIAPDLQPVRSAPDADRGSSDAGAASSRLVRRDVVLMGSSLTLLVEAQPELARTAIDATVDRLRRLEREISSWKPGSDIARLNARAGIEPVAVGSDAFTLLREAKRFHRETGGAFDVTIGPVWDLWPFRDADRRLPTSPEIADALEFVDASKIELNEARQTAFLPRAGMRVNLGGLGKGYAALTAARILADFGIRKAAISAGGDLYLVGRKSTGPWVVDIEHPLGGVQPIDRFQAGDVAIATSGNAKRFIVRDGKRFGHIVDPRTGRPVADCQSVSIVCNDPVAADAYATAVFVMGPEEGMAWIERQTDVEALIVTASGDILRSSGWLAATGRRPAAPAADHRAMAERQSDSEPDSPSSPPPARTTPNLPDDADSGSNRRTTRLEDMVPVDGGTFQAGPDRAVVPVEAFRIDRTEVSNKEYRAFLEATRDEPHRFCHPDEPPNKDHTPRYWSEFRPPLFRSTIAATLAPFDAETFRHDDHPVVGVDWWDAYAYSRWSGKRLPTRYEWEKAARGTDGRRWPWGDDWERKRANGGGEKWGERDGVVYTAPIDAFEAGASPFGCLNMAGNVAEWTEEGAVMGGSFRSNPSQLAAFAHEMRAPGYRSFCIGFRCAADRTEAAPEAEPKTTKETP